MIEVKTDTRSWMIFLRLGFIVFIVGFYCKIMFSNIVEDEKNQIFKIANLKKFHFGKFFGSVDRKLFAFKLKMAFKFNHWWVIPCYVCSTQCP